MGGLDKDTSKQKYANNKYSNAENLRPVTDEGLSTGALENIKGTEEILKMGILQAMVVITPSTIFPGPPFTATFFQISTTQGNSYNLSTSYKETISEVFDDLEDQIISANIQYYRLHDEDRIVMYDPNKTFSQVGLVSAVPPLQTCPFVVNFLPKVWQFIVIGHTPLREKTILFTVNEIGTEVLSQIWSMTYNPKDPKATAVLAILYNGRLDFSLDHPIEAIARYENTEMQRVYFTDNYNVPRTFNAVRKDMLALRLRDFSLVTDNALVIPLVTTENQDGGSLPTGLWYVTYRLRKFGGASTPIAPFSGATAVTTSKIDLSTNDPKYWDYAYATTVVNSTKLLNYHISILPIGFDEITIYAVHESEIGAFQAFLIKTETLTSESSYDFTLSTIQDLTVLELSDLQEYDVDFERVKTITAKYNRLLFGNIKEKSFKIDFDARAYRFEKNSVVSYETDIGSLTNKTWEVPETNDSINTINKDSTALSNDFRHKQLSNILGGTGPNVSYEFTFKEIILDDSSHAEPSADPASNPNGKGNPLWPEISPFVNMPASDDIDVTVNGKNINIGVGFTNFKNGRMESYFKGYMRDEVYRFGLVFYSITGRASEVKWIGDIRMPCAGDFDRNSDEIWKSSIAQWFSGTMNPMDAEAIIPKDDAQTKGWMLGLKFFVNFDNYLEIEDIISGFSIVRSPRKQKDKTIIAEGALGEIATKKLYSESSAADYLFGNLTEITSFKTIGDIFQHGHLTSEAGTLKFFDQGTQPVDANNNRLYIANPSFGDYQREFGNNRNWYEENAPAIGNPPVSIATAYLSRNTVAANMGANSFGVGTVRNASIGADFDQRPMIFYLGKIPFDGAYPYTLQCVDDYTLGSDKENLYNNTNTPSGNSGKEEDPKDGGGYYFEVPSTGKFHFRVGANLRHSVEVKPEIKSTGTKTYASYYGLAGNIVLKVRVWKKVDSFSFATSTVYEEVVKYITSEEWTSTFPVHHKTAAGQANFGYAGRGPISYYVEQEFLNTPVTVGDRVTAECYMDVQAGFGVYQTSGRRISLEFHLNKNGVVLSNAFSSNTKQSKTYFECIGKVLDPEKNIRLFNYTRISDGDQNLNTSNGAPFRKDLGNGRFYNHNVKDDWTITTVETDLTSDHYTNVGKFAPQYATLDCPDLKFPSGTTVQSYFAEDEEKQKYTLKPVAGYVHISEEDPTSNGTTITRGFNYDENSAVRGYGFSEIGTKRSEDVDFGVTYKSLDKSKYSKSLALCHNVSFAERLEFSTGDKLGKVKELKKVENKGYADVKTVDSFTTTPDNIKFLNVGYCSNVTEYLTTVDAGSALISPGVFTLFMAGQSQYMTKYLLNYSFGYGGSATRNLDPYLGLGHLKWSSPHGNEPIGYQEQHNGYMKNLTGRGNRIGFYSIDGSATKTPRRGQIAIVDICRELDNQYGGATYKERKDTEYIGIGNFTRIGDNDPVNGIEVFGGDIFQSAFAEKKLYSHPFIYNKYKNDTPGDNDLKYSQGVLASSPVIGRIYPIQSVVNTDMRVGYNFNNIDNYPDSNNDINNYPVAIWYEAVRDDYLCPILYAIEKKLQTYLVTGQNTLIGEFDNRIYMSQQKLNGELFDSWSVFKPLDYMDVDGHYGPINKLEVFNNEVLFFQDKSFGIVSLNPQSLITDGSGGEVQLGTGKGLVTFRYISNSIGAFHQWGVIKGKAAMYFFDAYHRKFFRYSSKGVEPLSDLKGMSSWFFDKIDGDILTNDNPLLFKGITAVYDQRFSEAIFTFHIESEIIQTGPGEIGVELGSLEAPQYVKGLFCLKLYGYYLNGVFWILNPVGVSWSVYQAFLTTIQYLNEGGTMQINFSEASPEHPDSFPTGINITNLDISASLTNGVNGTSFIHDNPNGGILVTFNGKDQVGNGQINNVILYIYCDQESNSIELSGNIPLLFISKNPYTLVYNEMTDAFTSFYSHFPRHYISDSKRVFSQPPNIVSGGYHIYMHDEGVRGVFYGNTADSIIELIINPKGDWTKVFNNLEYVTQASDDTGDLVDITFDKLTVSNEYQNSGEINLIVNDTVRRRMRTWRTQVPRDGKARIRNPHMVLKFVYQNNLINTRIIIHDILTHYIDAPM